MYVSFSRYFSQKQRLFPPFFIVIGKTLELKQDCIFNCLTSVSIKSFCTCALCGTFHTRCQYRTFQKPSQLKSKKMPRLNYDEQNQVIGMLNAGMSATVVLRHFSCTRKTIERLRRRFRVTGNVTDCPRSGRPRVTTACNDSYIVLQHLRNRRLTTGRQYGIHPQTVRNRLRQNVQPIHAYRPYFG